MNPQLWWFLTRSSGIVAWAVLALSVVVGLFLSTRALGKRPPAPWLLDVHRGVSGLAVVFTGLHLVTLVADSYVDFSVIDVLVPLATDWHPVAVAGGILALYLLLAIEITSLLRRRLSNRLWRVVHATSAVAYALATAHLLAAGTDAANPVLSVAVLVSMVLVAGLLFVRLLVPRGRARKTAPSRAGQSRAGQTHAARPRTGQTRARQTQDRTGTRPPKRARTGTEPSEQAATAQV